MSASVTDPALTTPPERWQRLKSVLAEVLEKDSDEARRVALKQLCGDDDKLLSEAESLLVEAEILVRDQIDALEACADKVGSTIPRQDPPVIGQRIGSYIVLREIGRGGMGAVYLAARADGYFEKQVAVKVLNCGNDNEELLRRFRAEHEILAQLDHPNIARLIDAGTTDNSLPYFIMEYVEGVPIRRFVAINDQPLDRRENGVGIVGIREIGRIAPHLAQTRNVAEHERTAGKRCFYRQQTERLVSCRQGIDGGSRHPCG